MIEIKKVSFKYSGGEMAGILHDIDITIPDGQTVLICGQSGCGKTTITRLINGLIPNYFEGELSGEVLIDGKNIVDQPIYETAKYAGSVFQNPRTQFFTVDSTGELAFGAENFGLSADEITRRIKKTEHEFGLEELMGRNIFSMSGGEKQKIACGSVAVSDTPVIVLDEPSSNLDIYASAELRKMISIWKAQGKTLVIAEHRLHYLRGLIDRVIYMKNGRIELDCTESEICRLPVEKQLEMGLRPFELERFPVKTVCDDENENFCCNGFCFKYGRRSGDAGINISSLELPQKGIIAIIGHNGAGKSTFARCLCGLEKKCKGRVCINGNEYKRKQRLDLCYMVMQDVNHQLFTESTEEELNISMYKPDDERVMKVLDSLDLLEYKERHPMSLSGGQKQRVAIATALVSDREILVFDEPTSGLDLKRMKYVADDIIKLKEMGKTILMITHDYELIVSCCTYVLHLEKGEAVEQYPLDSEGIKRLKKFFMLEGENDNAEQ